MSTEAVRPRNWDGSVWRKAPLRRWSGQPAGFRKSASYGFLLDGAGGGAFQFLRLFQGQVPELAGFQGAQLDGADAHPPEFLDQQPKVFEHQFGLVMFGAIVGVMLSLNFSAVANKETQEVLHPLPVEELRAFTEVFGRIKSDYVEPVEDKKLITEAINGMLTGLDPHSAYLDTDAFKELQIGTQGEFGGLGIEVSMEDGFVKVISPIEDTPAFRAGIKPGDLIVKLDDTAVKGLSLTDAIKRMRGKPNTPITLTIVRKGETKPIVFPLVRAVIKIQSVKSKMIEPGYAYIRITQFQEQTGENLTKAIDKLFKESPVPMNGLVLDLRNDPGGLLNGAVAVSAAFLPANSLVVYTDGRTDDAKMKLKASP